MPSNKKAILQTCGSPALPKVSNKRKKATGETRMIFKKPFDKSRLYLKSEYSDRITITFQRKKNIFILQLVLTLSESPTYTDQG